MKSPITKENGRSTWTAQPRDKYLATGVDRAGRRFVLHASNWRQLACYNLWRGTRWLVRDGKRFKIQTITN